MNIENIKNELLELQNKMEEMQKGISAGEESYKKIDVEVKALLTKQAIEGANKETEQEIKKLKAERIKIQNLLSDNRAVVEGLHQAIADKQVQLHQEEVEVAKEQYNQLAEQRKILDEDIEKVADSLCKKFDELLELDKAQRNIAKTIEVGTGRHTSYVIEDYISHKFRPYHRALGRVVYHMELVETDTLNKELGF